MKVILLKDIRDLGRKDAIIEVSDGFALNSLIPQGKAVQATPDKVAQVEKRRAQEAQTSAAQQQHVAEAIRTLHHRQLKLTAKVNEHGHLFKGIHKAEVVALVNHSIAGAKIDAGMVSGLPETIKETGEIEFAVAGAGEKATMMLVVEAQ